MGCFLPWGTFSLIHKFTSIALLLKLVVVPAAAIRAAKVGKGFDLSCGLWSDIWWLMLATMLFSR